MSERPYSNNQLRFAILKVGSYTKPMTQDEWIDKAIAYLNKCSDDELIHAEIKGAETRPKRE